jgi:hypothetical protein
MHIGFEGFMMVTERIRLLGCEAMQFGGQSALFQTNISLHLQGQTGSRARNQLSVHSVSAGFSLGVLFNPEDGVVCPPEPHPVSANYMALQLRRLYSSVHIVSESVYTVTQQK